MITNYNQILQKSKFLRSQIAPSGDAPARADYMREPPIEDVMADAAIKQVMARDGVAQEQLRALMQRVRSRLG